MVAKRMYFVGLAALVSVFGATQACARPARGSGTPQAFMVVSGRQGIIATVQRANEDSVVTVTFNGDVPQEDLPLLDAGTRNEIHNSGGPGPSSASLRVFRGRLPREDFNTGEFFTSQGYEGAFVVPIVFLAYNPGAAPGTSGGGRVDVTQLVTFLEWDVTRGAQTTRFAPPNVRGYGFPRIEKIYDFAIAHFGPPNAPNSILVYHDAPAVGNISGGTVGGRPRDRGLPIGKDKFRLMVGDELRTRASFSTQIYVEPNPGVRALFYVTNWDVEWTLDVAGLSSETMGHLTLSGLGTTTGDPGPDPSLGVPKQVEVPPLNKWEVVR